MRLSTLAPILLLATAWPSTAEAFNYVEIGVGIIGYTGANFIDQPSDQTVEGQEISPGYPGFAGPNTGVGIAFDFRIERFIGFELDFIQQTHYGLADLTITDLATDKSTVFVVELSNSAWHIPLLLKGVIPGEYVQPMLMLGPEFVLPTDAKLAIIGGTNTTATTYAAFDDSMYTMFTLGLGFELVLPFLTDDVSVRIPVSVRGSVNPGVDDVRSDVENTKLAPGVTPAAAESISYKAEWQYQIAANFGASIHF